MMKFVTIDGVDYEVLSMPKTILKCIANPFRNYILPVWLLRLIQRMSSSPLIAESKKRPGGWRAMEVIYENAEPVDIIDTITLRYNAFPMGLRNRKQYVTRKIAGLIREYSERGPVVVLGVGAGPGTNIQEGILLSEVAKENITAYLIDIDDDAFAYGTEKAGERGIAECVHFIKGDVRELQKHLPNVAPNIVKMIGIVEYLDDEEAREILRVLYDSLAPGGAVITHSLVDYHNNGPFLRRMVNWRFQERTKDELLSIMKAVGFRESEVFEEPMKIYTIIVGRK